MESLQIVFDFVLGLLGDVVQFFLDNPICLIPCGIFIARQVTRLISHLMGGD